VTVNYSVIVLGGPEESVTHNGTELDKEGAAAHIAEWAERNPGSWQDAQSKGYERGNGLSG
jgi:hypothetical protein